MSVHTAFPKAIYTKGNRVILKRVPMHAGYGAGDDGFVYSFYNQNPGKIMHGAGYDYANEPYRLKRIPSTSGSFACTYKLEAPTQSYACHFIIYIAWNGLEQDEGGVVVPVNGDYQDLRPINLVVMSRSERTRHFIKIGKLQPRTGQHNHNAILDDTRAKDILRLRHVYSRAALAMMFEVGVWVIKDAVTKKTFEYLSIAAEKPRPWPDEFMRIADFPNYGITRESRIVFFPVSASGQYRAYGEPRYLKDGTEYIKLVAPDGSIRRKSRLHCLASAIGLWRPSNRHKLICHGVWHVCNLEWKLMDSPRGENNNASILTEEEVREIRCLRGTCKRDELAKRYGISVSTIKNVWNNRSWSHVLPAKQTEPRLCVHCWSQFQANLALGNIQKYCSSRCKTAHRNRKQFSLLCSECGMQFLGTPIQMRASHKGNDVLCSYSCRGKVNSRKRIRS